MSTKDADRVEEHTGVPPEELDDAELEQAMDDLNIPKETVDASDQEAAGGGSSGAPSSDPLDEIAKLAQLHDQGVLTDEEFQAKKTQLLDEM
jgi:hypothetical protein